MNDPHSTSEKPEFPLTLTIAASVIIGIGLVALILPAHSTTYWVGRTDLEVQFLVTDLHSGLPIPHAVIHIRSEEEISGKVVQDNFKLTTDQNGRASRLVQNCSSSGHSGIFEETFSVGLPWWSYHASATHYTDSQDSFLNQPEIARSAKRGPPFATVVVSIRLDKAN